ncbi:MAG: deoxynucleoside kinase [Breznakibacter sp.]
MNQANRRLLVIEGNIGAGKTTLARMMSELLKARLVVERFEDNAFLPKFYENRDRYAFPLELSFLADRYNQLKSDIDSPDLFQQLTICDYHFFKSLVFARQTLSNDEFSLYRQLFHIIMGLVPRADLFVYLHRPIGVLLKLIEKRGRSYETRIDAAYLSMIQESYFSFFREHPEYAILVIDLEDLDFENDPAIFYAVSELIGRQYEAGVNRVKLREIMND